MHGALHLAWQRAIHRDEQLEARKSDGYSKGNFAGQTFPEPRRQPFEEMFLALAALCVQLRMPFSLK
jgi:hypothetical protein